MQWTLVLWSGACFFLALVCTALSVDGLLHARGPIKRYVRLFVFAVILLALPLITVIAAQIQQLSA